jgi:uncharacterized protein YodC (DUF2158 family)
MKEKSKYEIGNIVFLKDNVSPELSVYRIDKNGKIYCCWFDVNNQLQRDYFYKEQLECNDDDEPPQPDYIEAMN